MCYVPRYLRCSIITVSNFFFLRPFWLFIYLLVVPISSVLGVAQRVRDVQSDS